MRINHQIMGVEGLAGTDSSTHYADDIWAGLRCITAQITAE